MGLEADVLGWGRELAAGRVGSELQKVAWIKASGNTDFISARLGSNTFKITSVSPLALF